MEHDLLQHVVDNNVTYHTVIKHSKWFADNNLDAEELLNLIDYYSMEHY